jgi:uncharacterized protein (TIGR04255 family)
MSEQPYRRPPITEAVIEVRFATPLTPAEVDKASQDFDALYPFDQQIRNLGIAVELPSGPTNEPTTQVNQQFGYRRFSREGSEILLIWPSVIIVSQLAPYPGWNTFFARFARDWKAWKRATAFRKIIQIGVRFINRIDVPIKDNIIEESEYLNVYPQVPATFALFSGYNLQVQLPIFDNECTLTISTAAVPSPLIGHGSFVLDLDISMGNNPPQNDDAIYELLHKIRVKKNEAFEACVTNRARELFQK